MGKPTWRLNNLAENLEQELSTMNPQYQLMEVSRLIKDDAQGQLLLDDFLEAVITSYSIHYTKLYEAATVPGPGD